MKLQIKWMSALLLVIVLLAGCGTKDHGADHNGMDMGDETLVPIKVEIRLHPESIAAQEKAVIEAKVTQGGDPVDDAREVLFEIWRDDQERHEKIEGKHKKDGVYQIEKQFAEPGQYHVIAHVTARDMHSMPQKNFEVK